MKCDFCDKPAVVHDVSVRNGVKQEIHLCEEHAREQGFTLPGPQQPLSKILQQFVGAGETAKPVVQATISCPACGLRLAEFRQKGMLGCPECYRAFGRSLQGIIQRAQAGSVHHRGKSPRRQGATVDRQLELGRLVKDLEDAVASEQFERAAEIRDQLQQLEQASESSGDGEAGNDR